MPATWDAVLDSYERTLVGVEEALGTGSDLPALPAYRPPVTAPADAPTPSELARFEALQDRSRACVSRLRTAMEQTATDLGTIRRTGAAARAYDTIRQHTSG